TMIQNVDFQEIIRCTIRSNNFLSNSNADAELVQTKPKPKDKPSTEVVRELKYKLYFPLCK
ncbi:hypothetical protein, partial [Crocosphaera watsonii]|uniref:hypothetical protein n=1 Tax=Crocosphaera watsonii TaxID=263511 RepID=UPI001E39AF68